MGHKKISDEACKGCKHYSKCHDKKDVNMPNKENPVMKADDNEDNIAALEKMYPEIYNSMYPMVKSECDMMDEKHGKHHCPSREELDAMRDRILKKLDIECKDDDEDYCENGSHRDSYYRIPRPYGGRRAVRDLTDILLLRELIGRRRPPYYGPPYGRPPYGRPPYGGYYY